MSQQNADAVRAVYEAWNSGDMDALRELAHPDVIMRVPKNWPEPGPFGPEAHVESTVVFTLREGKISYVEQFWDHVEVLETLGLSTEGASTDSS